MDTTKLPPLAVALVAAAVVSLAVSSMGRAGAWLLLAVVVGLADSRIGRNTPSVAQFTL
jgi:hypothetical protein